MKTIYLLFAFVILFVSSCSDEAKALANCVSLSADFTAASQEYNPDATSDGFSEQTAEDCQTFGDALIAWYDAECDGSEDFELVAAVYREPGVCEVLHP